MNYADEILIALQNPNSNGILTFVLGFLSMIVVYNVMLYYQHRNTTYLYYTLYTLFIILSALYYVESDFLSLLLKPIKSILFDFVAFNRWIYNSLYFLFAFSFVNLKSVSKTWFKIIIYPIYALLIIAVVMQMISLIIGDNQFISNVFSRFFIPYIFLHSLVGYYVLFKIEAKFKYYIIIGSFVLLMASLTGAAIYYLDLLPRDNHLRDSIFYFGVVVENVLFSLALAHQQKYILEEKNRIILKDREKRLEMVIEAQEKERGRIAQDLHDGVLQQIGGVILQTRSLLRHSDTIKGQQVNGILKNLINSTDELRNISHQMMPKSLSELGAVQAIDDMLNLNLPYANIKYSFDYFNIDERLPENIELLLFRVAQELVNNIVKHSGASEVNFQLFTANQNVVMIVEDNGVGIAANYKKNGIGIQNINSRVESMNGIVSFESGYKQGTLVTLKVPIEKTPTSFSENYSKTS